MLISLRLEAAHAFRVLCNMSLAFGVISLPVWARRRTYLLELMRDDARATGDLRREPEPSNEEGGPMEAHPDLTPRTRGEKDDDGWLQFIPGGAIGYLKKWRFIVGDPDPHPSVPHGHGHGKPFPKLDPYLGWIYDAPKRASARLGKDDTRALWNDQRFRDFAAAALVQFGQENPSFVWRVPHPLRLPRRR